MNYITLNNNVKMPVLGFGVYQINDAAECEKAVLDAICTGYRLIDTAMSYHNEEAVGHAIEKCGVPRKELFITTKLWLADAGYDKTMKAFETSLKKLKLNYLDLYLIHQPVGDYYGSWKAMEELYKNGIVRAIGVAQKGVQIQSWGPFAEGRNGLFENEVLKNIAQKHHRSVAQVVLRWLIQRNVVCIPKSVNRGRIQENFNVFDFELSTEDMRTIFVLDTGKSCFFSHQDPAAIEMLCGLKR